MAAHMLRLDLAIKLETGFEVQSSGVCLSEIVIWRLLSGQVAAKSLGSYSKPNLFLARAASRMPGIIKLGPSWMRMNWHSGACIPIRERLSHNYSQSESQC